MDQGVSIGSIPFILVTGFLGSGKTSFLKRFLNHFADEKRIAVIQNEFADANVDSLELKETGKSFEIVEINKGSVFCVCLLSDFIKSLADVMAAFLPDVVILEATGLADPIAIGQLLSADQLDNRLYLAHVWSIVDVTTFLEMEPMIQRMVHQVRVADTIILNKTDGVSPERISETESRLLALNPYAEQIKTSFCDLPATSLNETFSPQTGGNKTPPVQTLLPFGRPTSLFSAVLRTTKRISPVNLETFLQNQDKDAYRIKGFVNLSDGTVVSVQVCFGRVDIETVKKEPGPTELVALGPGVEQSSFSERFTLLAD